MKTKRKLVEKRTFHYSDWLWDLWCVASIIGIWPRFFEPNMLKTTKLSIPLKGLPKDLQGLKILQFSDLHFNRRISASFLKKIINRIRKLKPDLIVFTGDLICYSILEDESRLAEFLNSFHAPYGCYAIFGNHDYDQNVSINDQGDYDVVNFDSSMIGKGLKRLFYPTPLSGKITETARDVSEHQVLQNLFDKTPFQLLNNKTQVIPINKSYLNICGLGEYMMGKCRADEAFQGYKEGFPGIILAHNPDSVTQLNNSPGDVILCGHTHGAQLNFPYLWKKFILMENTQFKRGLFKVGNKWMYVNRGVGSVMPFRWFSVPEILELKLVHSK